MRRNRTWVVTYHVLPWQGDILDKTLTTLYIAVTSYLLGIGNVFFVETNWHIAKPIILNDENDANAIDFTIHGTVVWKDGVEVHTGSRCSERYVYYKMVGTKVQGPFKRLEDFDHTIGTIVRGYENVLFKENFEYPPTL